MKFHVVTLFPDMIRDIVHTSITGRAVDKGILTVDTVNIRDYSIHGTKRVDDYPYGGGAGMVMEPEPVFQAICEAKEKAVPGTRVVYLTPQAKVLTQIQAEELAREEELILLCGHYEGIDERVLEECVTDYVSIGDYVLTGGELAAAVLIDAVSRFVPGVLHNEESSRFESLHESLLEYPHYTRPEVWHDKAVPEVLRSGDHEKTECWRREQALQRTMERRPDLLDGNFRLITIWFGPENGEKRARDLSSELSHFSEVMNYNRNKLRKQSLKVQEKDFLLIFLPEKPEEEMLFSERFRNLYGKKTPAVLISGEQTESSDSCRNFLKERGVFVLEEIALQESENEENRMSAALKIRHVMEEYVLSRHG